MRRETGISYLLTPVDFYKCWVFTPKFQSSTWELNWCHERTTSSSLIQSQGKKQCKDDNSKLSRSLYLVCNHCVNPSPFLAFQNLTIKKEKIKINIKNTTFVFLVGTFAHTIGIFSRIPNIRPVIIYFKGYNILRQTLPSSWAKVALIACRFHLQAFTMLRVIFYPPTPRIHQLLHEHMIHRYHNLTISQLATNESIQWETSSSPSWKNGPFSLVIRSLIKK